MPPISKYSFKFVHNHWTASILSLGALAHHEIFKLEILVMVSFSNFSPNDSRSSCIVLQTSAFLLVVMLNTMYKIVHTVTNVTTYTPCNFCVTNALTVLCHTLCP